MCVCVCVCVCGSGYFCFRIWLSFPLFHYNTDDSLCMCLRVLCSSRLTAKNTINLTRLARNALKWGVLQCADLGGPDSLLGLHQVVVGRTGPLVRHCGSAHQQPRSWELGARCGALLVYSFHVWLSRNAHVHSVHHYIVPSFQFFLLFFCSTNSFFVSVSLLSPFLTFFL